MSEIQSSPQLAPKYALYREVSAAADTLPEVNGAHGMNMAEHQFANIQVLPAGGANPNVAVLWWSDEAAKFIQDNPAVTKSGVGADTPYEFSVECRGRKMFVAVTGGIAGGQSAKIMVSGFGLNAAV